MNLSWNYSVINIGMSTAIVCALISRKEQAVARKEETKGNGPESQKQPIKKIS
jgi:hypothetical protein